MSSLIEYAHNVNYQVETEPTSGLLNLEYGGIGKFLIWKDVM